MTTRINRDLDKRYVMSCMVGLMQNLEKLSPHPNRPNYRGALFTALPGWCHAVGEHDGMMGNLLLEGMLGGAFSQVASNVTNGASEALNTGNLASSAMAAYAIYKGESDAEMQKASAHGRGSLARMSGVSISGKFNQRSSMTTAMQDFMDDMPERLKIEGQLASFLKKLKALDMPVYEYSAPERRFAA